MHSTTVGLALAGLLIVAGTFLVVSRSSPPPTASQTVAWGGSGAVLNPSYLPSATHPEDQTVGIMQQVQSGAPYSFTLPTPETTSSTGTADGGFDFNAFISMLSAEKNTAPQAGASTDLGNAYAFIPTGLISTTTQTTRRTVLQKALYDYGNDLGSLIQSFEQDHMNQSQLITDYLQDRNNSTKVAVMETLGNQYATLGDSILAMDSVPSQMTSAHAALAQSYKELGAKLGLVAQTQGDAAFIAAIETYNNSAQTYVKNYIAVSDLFAAYGVTFSTTDPGSVFVFSPVSL